jgi:hypothetical protein
VSVLLLLVGCYRVETYQEDLDAAVCTWKATCYAEDEASCLAAAVSARQDADPDCEYNPDEARECVNGFEKLGCPGGEDTAGQTWDEDFGFPSACDKVWECP